MFRESALPYLRKLSEELIVSHSVRIFGLGESSVDDIFAEEMNRMTNPTMAPYAKECDCLLQITAKAKSVDEAEKMIAPVMEHVMQRLGEINSPARPSDLARQLRLPPASVARAADALVVRGWVQRLASPIDHKAVYLKATKEGKRQQHVIAATLNLSARKHMWGKLDEQGRRAVISASREVIGDQQRKDEAARLALLNQLQPL